MRWKSSNPILSNQDAFNEFYGQATVEKSNVTTMSGVINKTGILGGLAVAAGMGGYAFIQANPQYMMGVFLTSLIVMFGVYFALRGNPARAPLARPRLRSSVWPTGRSPPHCRIPHRCPR